MEFLILMIVTLGAVILAVSVATVILRVLFHLMEGSLWKLARGNVDALPAPVRSVNG